MNYLISVLVKFNSAAIIVRYRAYWYDNPIDAVGDVVLLARNSYPCVEGVRVIKVVLRRN